MAVKVLLTTDTELSSGLHATGASGADNFAVAYEGRCGRHAYGIPYQLKALNKHGLTGVFFVDPLPGLIFGQQMVDDMVEPILAAGHDVQLHIHTEWLEFAEAQPVGDLRGDNIADFPLDAQVTLLGMAREMLIKAGAPAPMAFRAGNYGANDDTLRALAQLGMRWDTSFNPSYAGDTCTISLPDDRQSIVEKHDIEVVPVSSIEDAPGNLRHTQLCALSAREMRAALNHAAEQGAEFFNIVSHSFELIVRENRRPNRIMLQRFRALLNKIAKDDRLTSATFADLDAVEGMAAAPMPPHQIRRVERIAEQMASKLIYESNAAIAGATGSVAIALAANELL